MLKISVHTAVEQRCKVTSMHNCTCHLLVKPKQNKEVCHGVMPKESENIYFYLQHNFKALLHTVIHKCRFVNIQHYLWGSIHGIAFSSWCALFFSLAPNCLSTYQSCHQSWKQIPLGAFSLLLFLIFFSPDCGSAKHFFPWVCSLSRASPSTANAFVQCLYRILLKHCSHSCTYCAYICIRAYNTYFVYKVSLAEVSWHKIYTTYSAEAKKY